MANAEKTAPLKKEQKFIEIEGESVVDNSKEHLVLAQEFDPFKKYVFELANRNPTRDLPVMNARTHKAVDHQDFIPSRNLVYTSQVVWNGRRRMVRYYDGCDSIFFDKQPKEPEVIKMLLAQTQRREFNHGKFACDGTDRMLLLYLFICSWNAESPFRTARANTVFIPVDNEKRAESELDKLDESEMALTRAKEATFQKMRIHSSYLGIELIDYDSGNQLSEAELRLKYRRKAVEDSANFNSSFGNEKIEIKYFIDRAIEKKIITNKLNPNKATWGSSGAEICDISGLISSEAISQRLFEFSQSEEGQEFLIQLKNISGDF